MANKTKYSKTVISEILSELAQGKSIRSCLSPINKLPERPCWETFRTWMRDTSKYPNLRAEYENAKTDGIEYLLSDAQDLLNESIANSKLVDKTDLGKTHLIKAFVDLSKWKSEQRELIYLRHFPYRSYRLLKRFYIGDSHEKIRYMYFRALVEACEIANKNLKKYL